MRRERRCLPVDRWPLVDRQLWTDGFRQAALFEESGLGAHWSQSTRRNVALGYGRWLCWLHDTGQLDPAMAPGDRVTPARVSAYVTELAPSCAPYTLLSRINELGLALRVLAPGGDRPWLVRLHANLRARAAPVRNKRGRLRSIGELIDLGKRLMRQAEAAGAWSPLRRAVHYRDGLMILLLAYRPVRLRNFASIRLDHHLVERGNRYWLVFGAAETKTGQPYEVLLPQALVDPLQRYLTHHRPLLLRGERGGVPAAIDALWVSEVGTPLEIGALSARIRKHTGLA